MSAAIHDLQDKIVRFLTEELGRKEHRMVVRIELTHTSEGFAPEAIKEWTREASPEYFTTAEYVEPLAADILELAEDRANVYRSSDNRFTLRAYQMAGGRMGYAFKILPSIDHDGGAGAGLNGDLPATQGGVLAMQMRNNEFVMRMNKDMIAGAIGVLTKQVNDLMEENKQLRDERSRMVAEISMGKAAEAERELAVVRQAGQESRKDMIVGKAVSLLPVVASRFLEDKTGSSGTGTALATMVSELGSTISPQQLASIASTLTMEQRVIFAEAMRLAKMSTGSGGGNVVKKPDGAAPPNGTPSTAQ